MKLNMKISQDGMIGWMAFLVSGPFVESKCDGSLYACWKVKEEEEEEARIRLLSKSVYLYKHTFAQHVDML